MTSSGTLIISLDFELHWGLFATVGSDSKYMDNLRNTPAVVEKILKIFEKREISATWAIIGLLFAESKAMLNAYEPKHKPVYRNESFNPYGVPIGNNEIDDPIHFASSLIKRIQSLPGQEIATHTFSHFLCRENGATIEAFLDDLDAAIKIARTYNIQFNTIVFPKNQLIKEFISVLPDKGISVYRGSEKGWMYTKVRGIKNRKISFLRQLINKAGRYIDAYLPLSGPNTWRTDEIKNSSEQITSVPSSCFVRPYNSNLKFLEWMKLYRIKSQIKYAARNNEMVHLHWHPHNFGRNIDENLTLLNDILDCFEQCRKIYNMKSMSINEYSKLLIR